jgi:hypothetical protein
MTSTHGQNERSAVRTIGLMAIIVLLLAACGQNTTGQSASAAGPGTLNTTASSAQLTPTDSSPVTDTSWSTYTDTVGGYTLAAPADWHIQPLDGGMIVFQNPNGATIHLDEKLTGRPENTIGGVDILSRESTKQPDSVSDYSAVLPNHSRELNNQPISTPAGTGRLFTLERSYPAASGNTQVWREQHAYIPADKRFYDIWLVVGPQDNDTPVPQFAQILKEFRLTGAATP